jgi:hypothetical protein
MALDFPNTPTTGQIFVAPSGVSYQWDGTLWKTVSMTGGGTGDFYASIAGTQAIGAAWAVVNTGSVVTGNAGGWYNPTTYRFTPPAGRYFIFGGWGGGLSAANSLLYTAVYKNGVLIPNSISNAASLATNLATPVVGINVDANGTDYFNLYGYSGAGAVNVAGNAWFGAFPIASGVPSPGFVGVPWRLISRQTLGVAAADINVQNIPSDINDLMFDFDMTPVTNSQGLILQMYDNAGALDTTTNHYQYSKVQHSTGFTAGTAALTYHSVGDGYSSGIILSLSGAAGSSVGNVTGIRGKGMIPNIRGARLKHLDWQCGYVDDVAANWRGFAGSGYRNVSGLITGIRLVFGTGNVAAGSTLAVWGSP